MKTEIPDDVARLCCGNVQDLQCMLKGCTDTALIQRCIKYCRTGREMKTKFQALERHLRKLNSPMNTTAQKPKQYRQGDVQLRYVDLFLPSKLKPVVRQSGRLVLANGTSGHAHFIDDPGTEMYEAADGGRFLTIKGNAIKGRFPIIERSKLHVLVRHPKLGEIAFAEGDLKVSGKSAVIDGHFALLRHDADPVEHYQQALPRGQAELMEQSEYNQEEIRRVQD